jgi:hypothetical protein
MRTVSVLTGLVLPLALSAQQPAGLGDAPRFATSPPTTTSRGYCADGARTCTLD